MKPVKVRPVCTDALLDIIGVILGDRNDALGVVMTLSGFFDESERSDGSEPLSVAGYIFRPKGYEHFRRKWARMLRSGPTPTTHFHMTNLYARTYEYEGWSVEDRAGVLRQAVDAVRKHTYCGITVLFSQSEFEQMAPASWVDVYGSIYSAACQIVLRATEYWMDLNGSFDPIAYVFESGHRFWDEANSILTAAIRSDPDLKRRYRHLSHTAVDKKNAFGLQAADMLAWITARSKVAVPNNHTMRAFVPIITELVDGKSSRYQIFSPTGETLRRFFYEQTVGPTVFVELDRPKRGRLR